MKNALRFLIPFCLLPATLLTGCYTLYVQPESGPMASITFDKDSSLRFSIATYVNPSDCSGGRIFVSPILDENSTTRRFVAGKSVSLSFDADLGTSPGYQSINFHGCDRTITFTPVDGERYRAQFNGMCQLRILKADGTPLRANEYQNRKWIRPFSGSGAFCEAL